MKTAHILIGLFLTVIFISFGSAVECGSSVFSLHSNVRGSRRGVIHGFDRGRGRVLDSDRFDNWWLRGGEE